MNGKITHFAIYADDVERAAGFYGKVFQWSFNDYGMPGFRQIKTADDNTLIGAVQQRSYAPVPEKIIGLECSVAVADVEQTAQAVLAAGGRIVMPVTQIPGVGRIMKFLDTEGSLLCAVQYG